MEKMKILLVEDDSDDRLFFARALTKLEMDIELHEAKNGEDCLSFLQDNDVSDLNLIFLDLNMPVMDGFECLEVIKSNSSYDHIVIAIYSTSSSDKDIEKTFLQGANIYLNKPTNFNDLVTSLKQIIKTNWAYKENDFKKENFLLKVK